MLDLRGDTRSSWPSEGLIDQDFAKLIPRGRPPTGWHELLDSPFQQSGELRHFGSSLTFSLLLSRDPAVATL